MDITRWRIDMADIARACGPYSNVLETVVGNSEADLFFLALILANDPPRAMIVNRGSLARTPDERNDGKGVIGRAIKKVLRVRFGWDCPSILFLQPTAIGNKAT
jgi:hypothetical protein